MISNQSVINAFANGKTARSTNMRSEGNKLFSYNTCIAQRLENGTIVVNSTKYSVSTSKVQTYTRNTLWAYKEIANVPKGAWELASYIK